MTLNGVMALILRFSTNSTAFQADYVIVVEDRPIMTQYSENSSGYPVLEPVLEL